MEKRLPLYIWKMIFYLADNAENINLTCKHFKRLWPIKHIERQVSPSYLLLFPEIESAVIKSQGTAILTRLKNLKKIIAYTTHLIVAPNVKKITLHGAKRITGQPDKLKLVGSTVKVPQTVKKLTLVCCKNMKIETLGVRCLKLYGPNVFDKFPVGLKMLGLFNCAPCAIPPVESLRTNVDVKVPDSVKNLQVEGILLNLTHLGNLEKFSSNIKYPDEMLPNCDFENTY
jgi:hypothetical protein